MTKAGRPLGGSKYLDVIRQIGHPASVGEVWDHLLVADPNTAPQRVSVYQGLKALADSGQLVRFDLPAKGWFLFGLPGMTMDDVEEDEPSATQILREMDALTKRHAKLVAKLSELLKVNGTI